MGERGMGMGSENFTRLPYLYTNNDNNKTRLQVNKKVVHKRLYKDSYHTRERLIHKTSFKNLHIHTMSCVCVCVCVNPLSQTLTLSYIAAQGVAIALF